ncbi:hypothetical protein T492DRAFT_833782 [Pavlovales sp. CCMP2436]|nr:hypothetical protein T492DRAFT_833782 [Pavlovales sp. CCMP2436]
MADLRGKQTALEAKLAHEKSKIAEFESSRGDVEARAKESSAAHSKLAKKVEKETAGFAALEKKDIEMRESIKALKAQIKKGKAGLEKEAKRTHELAAATTRADEDMERLSAEAEAQGKKVAEAEAKIAKTYESLAGEVAPLRSKLAALQVLLPYSLDDQFGNMEDRAPHAAKVSEKEAVHQELQAEAELLQTKAQTGAARAAKAVEVAERAVQGRDANRAAAKEAGDS